MLDQLSYSIYLHPFHLIEWTEGEKLLKWADESGAGTPQWWDKADRSDFSNFSENIIRLYLIFNVQFQKWGKGKKEGLKMLKCWFCNSDIDKHKLCGGLLLLGKLKN